MREATARRRFYTRTMSQELDYLREHLKKDEASILAMALRRGVFETFKSLVIKQYAAGRLSGKQAQTLLGEKVFGKLSSWLPEPEREKR